MGAQYSAFNMQHVTCNQCAEFTPSQSHDVHAIGICQAVERYEAGLGRKIRASEDDRVQDAIGNFDSPGGRGRWRLCRPFIERECTKFVPKQNTPEREMIPD